MNESYQKKSIHLCSHDADAHAAVQRFIQSDGHNIRLSMCRLVRIMEQFYCFDIMLGFFQCIFGLLSVFEFTRHVLSAEEISSLKKTVQFPLEFDWDVKEQRPRRRF